MKFCIPLIATLLLASTASADIVSRAARAQARADRLHTSVAVAMSQPVAVQYVQSPVVTYRVAAPVVVRSAPVVRVYVRHWFW